MAAQSITFLGRIAFFMRGHTATKVWPEGHLLSSHEERRQRRAKGVPPLGAPGGFVDFLSMKIDSDAGPSSRPYKKGCGPGDGLPHFFSPAPNRSPEASGSLVV